MLVLSKGWLAIAKLKPLSLFIVSILTLSNAFSSINNREMKSESGFSLAMASQPFMDSSKANNVNVNAELTTAVYWFLFLPAS